VLLLALLAPRAPTWRGSFGPAAGVCVAAAVRPRCHATCGQQAGTHALSVQ
jgi:hypothetical protein